MGSQRTVVTFSIKNSTPAQRATRCQSGLHFLVRTGNDVRGNEAITHSLAGVSTGADCGVHSTGLTTHHHGDVATSHIFTADQGDLGSLGHGIGRFDGGNHATGLNHAQGNALNR